MMPMPIANFSFGCNPTPTVSSDPWLGSLKVSSQETLGCQFSNNGVTSTALVESDSTIATLRNKFRQSHALGFALEVWITPTSSNDSTLASRPIIIIGTQEEEDRGVVHGHTECEGRDLSLSQRGGALEVLLSEGSAGELCRRLSIEDAIVPNALLQVVVALNQGETSVYLNGMPIVLNAPNKFHTDLKYWNPDSTLQLFSSHSDPSLYFEGSIHQVSLYDQIVKEKQVASMYKHGRQDLNQTFMERESLRLVASTEPANFVQGRASSFTIGGFNSTTVEWQILVEIVTVPTFGRLQAEEGMVLTSGYRIPLLGDAIRTSLVYEPFQEEYFNVPCCTHGGKDLGKPQDLIEYRLVAVNKRDKSTVLGTSDTVQQRLAVLHINHEPRLVVPNQVFVPLEQTSGLAARPRALLEGIELKDEDQNIDQVRVDVWAKNGTLTIPEDYLHLADFKSCANRNPRSWQCHGTGVASRNMTFLAEPDDATKILSNLQYDGFFWHQKDEIRLRVYDGTGGSCLAEEEHQVRFSGVGIEVNRTCYELEASIAVPAIPRPEINERIQTKQYIASLFRVKNFGAPEIVFWSMILLLGTLCCCCCRFFLNCLGNARRVGGCELHNNEEKDQTKSSGLDAV